MSDRAAVDYTCFLVAAVCGMAAATGRSGVMELLRRFKSDETLEEMRQRMLAETSAYITECLRHPEFTVNIPVIPAGSGSFPPSFSSAFWDSVLKR